MKDNIYLIRNSLEKLIDNIAKFRISLPIRYLVDIKTGKVVRTEYKYGNKWMTDSEINELFSKEYEAINKLQTILYKSLGVSCEKEN